MSAFDGRIVGKSHAVGSGFEFTPADALLVVDVLNDFDHDDAESLLASFRERGARMAAVLTAAREAGVPVIYVNDDRDRWDSDAPASRAKPQEGPGATLSGRCCPCPATAFC